MAFEAKLSLRQTQKMVMTPMLQQAISLLQLSRLEMLQALHQELQENPILEEVTEGIEEFGDVPDVNAVGEEPTPESNGEGTAPEIDWESYLQDASDYRPSVRREEIERFDSESLLTRPGSLQDHLLFQLHLTVRDPELLGLGSLIIGDLDDNGYLRSSLPELASLARATPGSLEAALRWGQTLDPTGVGARDLRECLLIQLGARPERHELAEAIVSGHLHELERRQAGKIAEALGVPLKEAQEAVALIVSLEPKPGKTFSGEEPRYITPDVNIHKIDGRYLVTLNEEGLPRLRTIEQRKRTLVKVCESLVKVQRDFLDYGISRLKPLTLREVADDISMHESTVSRVTTSKYVQTPQGLFELKYFFHRGVPSTGGDTVSSVKVKDLVRRYLTAKDSQKPLSDQRLVEILARVHGVEIARRTVAKYRGQLKIPSSNRRRQF